jgi:hypothetical protein
LPELYKYTVYDRISGDFPAKSTVYAPFIYGSGQPYTCADAKAPQALPLARDEDKGIGQCIGQYIVFTLFKFARGVDEGLGLRQVVFSLTDALPNHHMLLSQQVTTTRNADNGLTCLVSPSKTYSANHHTFQLKCQLPTITPYK